MICVASESVATDMLSRRTGKQLTKDDRHQYLDYLKDMRKEDSQNRWRSTQAKRDYLSCKNGFMQQHSNLDIFLTNRPARVQTDKD